MSKRGQGLQVNTIIVFALALLVLFIIGYMFTRGAKSFGNSTAACPGTCIGKDATCSGKITSDRCQQKDTRCCVSAEQILGG